MNPRKPPRRCVVCGATYHKRGSAKTCGSLECRAEVVRRRHAKWRAENPDVVKERFETYRKANLTYFRDNMRKRRRHAAPPT